MKSRSFWHPSRIGPFTVKQLTTGDWRIVWNGEEVGTYAHPQQAVDELCGGHIDSLSCGVDTATLGLEDEIGSWRVGKPSSQ